MRKIIASLDIGTYSVKLVVAEILKGKMNVLAVSESKSDGIKNGVIINKEEVIPVLKETFQKCEDILDLSVRKVIVTVPSYEADFMMSEGSTTITNEEKIVRGNDIVRAMQASIYNKVPSGLEIVGIVPTNFCINDEEIVKNPINCHANKLTVKSVITMIPKKNVAPIFQCLEKLNIEVIDISFSSLGDYYCLQEDRFNNLVGAIINIGAGTTTLSIFNKGVLTNTKVLEIGGQNIDNDISFIYKVTKSDAKQLKENLGLAHTRLASASSLKKVTNKLGEEITINQYELSEVIMSRLEEILNVAKKQINLLTKKEIHYIIVTGGVSEMPDFELTLGNVFGNNASLANVNEIGARHNKFSACLGLIKYYDSKLKLRNKSFSIFDLEEQEILSGKKRKMNISDNSILGKLFGYFFDN